MASPLPNSEMADNRDSPGSPAARDSNGQRFLPSVSAMAALRLAPAINSNTRFSKTPTFTRSSFSDRWSLMRQNDPASTPARKLDTPVDNPQTPEVESALSELDLFDRFLNDSAGFANSVLSRHTENPLFRALNADMDRLWGFTDELERQLDQAQEMQEEMLQFIKNKRHIHEDTESWIDLVSGGRRESVPEMPPSEPPAAEQHNAVDDKAMMDVVLNRSHTEAKMRSDGSVWRKTTTTRRFADGHEETDESVEVHHPPENSGPDNATEKASSEKSTGGWFWSS
ncbi:hypothetical protein N7512_003137 [Penicillium capsulatum]|nr:hypothetical protein N7512_003137 [Penicillium capsulatum]